jgi:alpha-L-fucosidase
VLGIVAAGRVAEGEALPAALPPMPVLPEVMPRNTVKLGDPKEFEEMKMDFPMEEGPFGPTWESIKGQHPGEIAWLREAKFGMWVHFGPQAAGESGDWYARKLYQPEHPAYANHLKNHGHPSEKGYMEVLRTWDPRALDPGKLVQTYKEAGGRFLIIQGVHHDNFDLWNSRYQPWNSVNMGPKRDLLGEWSKACLAADMRYGLAFHHEYTWWWWVHAFNSDKEGPKAGVPYDGHRTLADGRGKWWEGYDPRLLYTVNLLEYEGIDSHRTAPVQGIFTRHLDYGRWYATQWALRILDAVEKYDPDFVYTDGNSTQPFSGLKSGTGLKADAHQRMLASYFNRTLARRGTIDTFSITKFHPPGNGIVRTYEGSIPRAINREQVWIGENAVGDWFYGPGFVYDAGAVVRCLLEYVARDGNYLLCVSLKPDGSLDEGSSGMLREVGAWMKINGQGIYGSRAWKVLGEGGGADGALRVLPNGQLGARQAEFAFTAQDWRFTQGKDGAVYAYCMTVPGGGTQVRIRSLGSEAGHLQGPIKKVTLLGSEGALTWRQEEEALVIECPAEMRLRIAVAFRIE